MDFSLSGDLLDLQAQARQLGVEAAEAASTIDDSWMVGHDRSFALQLAQRGWLGMTWPVEAGGGGRPPIERLIVFEQLISLGAPVAASWFADRQMGPTLLQFGTDDQQRRYLPGILDGTSSWAIGMSEPDAGSNVAGIRTRAEREGDHFRVNGQKIWTSGAALADFIYLIARTDPDAPPHAGLSELVVDLRSPGISIVPVKDLTGSHHFCEVFLEDVLVPADTLVGALNGSFGQVMRQMEHERGGIDRLVSNKRLFDDIRPLADAADPRVRQELAAIETGYQIGRLMVLREVLQQAPKQFSAATKCFCTEFEQRVAKFCASVLGADAMLAEPGLSDRVARNLGYANAY
ncbi:MAG: acyl-CoA dehydrogenase family protein, partial [Acidimicrobiales bacterium]|nr:acyl-CoA dehydrogenase family protein [Acidimicrobiales bacterium]